MISHPRVATGTSSGTNGNDCYLGEVGRSGERRLLPAKNRPQVAASGSASMRIHKNREATMYGSHAADSSVQGSDLIGTAIPTHGARCQPRGNVSTGRM